MRKQQITLNKARFLEGPRFHRNPFRLRTDGRISSSNTGHIISKAVLQPHRYLQTQVLIFQRYPSFVQFGCAFNIGTCPSHKYNRISKKVCIALDLIELGWGQRCIHTYPRNRGGWSLFLVVGLQKSGPFADRTTPSCHHVGIIW